MAPRIDPVILSALSLNPSTTSIATHGGSGFASTFKLIANSGSGQEKPFFVKTRSGDDAERMFAGEHMSLNFIHEAVPSLCPRSYANGKLESGAGSFLVTDFLDMSSRSSSSSHGSGMSLAQKIAKLHSTPAPIPEGYERPQFGFPVPTCCGNTVQENTFSPSWCDFYANSRLLAILSSAERSNGRDPELRQLVERTARVVVPRLLRDGHLRSGGEDVRPVVVHGDLWSGNHGRGSIGGGALEEVVFDPSSCWAHSEYEFGIMRMLPRGLRAFFGGLEQMQSAEEDVDIHPHRSGGFGPSFSKEYHKYKPKDEPVEEWDDRVELYELYHHLNHYSIFGGGYKGGAVSIMRNLLRKYDDGSED